MAMQLAMTPAVDVSHIPCTEFDADHTVMVNLPQNVGHIVFRSIDLSAQKRTLRVLGCISLNFQHV